MTPPLLASPVLGATHGFFTRQGGVSVGPYASLNCSLSGKDSRDAVLANRGLAVGALGAAPEQLVGLTQVHGARAVRVSQPWQPSQGPEADAMVTNKPGIALGIVTADCAPVLLADPMTGVIGAAHAGWRGAVAGVLEATVDCMMGLGARLGSIAAAVGPCIGQVSYEVGADLRDAVLEASRDAGRFFAVGRREGRWQFDLAGYCRWRLVCSGVKTVDTIEADTAAEEARFFSHRRRVLAGGGAIGHQISIIALA